MPREIESPRNLYARIPTWGISHGARRTETLFAQETTDRMPRENRQGRYLRYTLALFIYRALSLLCLQGRKKLAVCGAYTGFIQIRPAGLNKKFSNLSDVSSFEDFGREIIQTSLALVLIVPESILPITSVPATNGAPSTNYEPPKLATRTLNQRHISLDAKIKRLTRILLLARRALQKISSHLRLSSARRM